MSRKEKKAICFEMDNSELPSIMTVSVALLLITVTAGAMTSSSSSVSGSDDHCRDLRVPEGYDPSVHPSRPTEVQVDFTIIQVHEINDLSQTIIMEVSTVSNQLK